MKPLKTRLCRIDDHRGLSHVGMVTRFVNDQAIITDFQASTSCFPRVVRWFSSAPKSFDTEVITDWNLPELFMDGFVAVSFTPEGLSVPLTCMACVVSLGEYPKTWVNR